MTWHRATTLDELTRRGAVVFKHGRHQLAILSSSQGCHAVANRCPHEGYPLSQGTVDDKCVLTCHWHNWKFELATGRNLWGGDKLRVYPLELRAGEVWVDLRDPPAEQVLAEAVAGLREAFDEMDHGFIARQLVRIAGAGFDPASVAIPLAVSWCAPRLEWGLTHAIPASVEWLALHDAVTGEGPEALERRLVYLCEAIEHMAFDGLRQPERPFPPARTSGDSADPAAFHSAFLAEVEAQDEAAIARVRGAIASGRSFAELERSLVHSALRHYAGFGHALIYVGLIGDLVARHGDAVADPAISALVRYHLYANREDQIPEFRPLGPAVAELADLSLAWDPEPLAAPQNQALEITELIAAPLKQALAWVSTQLRSHGVRPVWDALVRACAHNMLAFDLRHAAASSVKVADNIGWLDFTHALTFASAVRIQCTKYPELWGPALLQMACFCARNRAYLLPAQDIDHERWVVDDPAALFAELDERLLDHGIPLPIFPVHLLKTRRAVARELDQVSAATRPVLLAALNRFLHSPLQLRHARRDVHQAIALVGAPD